MRLMIATLVAAFLAIVTSTGTTDNTPDKY